MAVNLLTSGRGFQATVARIIKAFDDRALVFPSCASGNAIAFAAAGNIVEISFDDMKEGALKMKKLTGLNLLPTLTRLAQARTCLNNQMIL